MAHKTQKLTTLLTLILALLTVFNSFSQKDTVQLKETIITDFLPSLIYKETSRIVQVINHDEIAKAPIQSINELLDFALSVDIRNRGSNSVQSDIGIRGGSFEQTLVLLNGVIINDPQTGHHTMNIPVELSDVERIEILEGPGSRIYGVNAFAGAINIITSTQKDNFVKLGIEEGENKTYNVNAAISFNKKNFHNYLSVTQKASDGYTNNTDYNIANIFNQSDYTLSSGVASLQLGYVNKQFGANEFYSSTFPNEFEQTKTFFINAGFSSSKFLHLKPSVYYRRNQDRFELFRSNPAPWYSGHNYHLTDVYGAGLTGYFRSCIGKTSFGTEFRSENILSNVLGTPLDSPQDVPSESGAKFTKSSSRHNLGLFAEQAYSYKKLDVSAGVYVNYNTVFGWKTNLSADANYKLSDKLQLFGSVNQSMRLPTFTDLYYVGPTNLGNPNLKPEEATTYEMGLKYLSEKYKAHISLFHRVGNNIIDWVKPSDTSKWESRNITQVIANGVDMSVQLNMQSIYGKNTFVRSINISYSYLTLEKQSSNYISYYALDYLRNKITLRFDHNIYKDIKASWALRYHDRAGTYADAVTGKAVNYKPFFTTDLKVYMEKPKWTVFVEANNLFNEQYQDIGNILMQGRWIGGGFSYKLFY